MTTNFVPVSAGTGTDVATNTISEDAVTKHLQRMVLNDSSGVEQIIGTSLLALDSTVAKDASLTTIDTDLKANITLHAGTNIVGKVTTDQTTHGTTDLIADDLIKIAGGAITATNVAITDKPLNIGVQAVSSENSAITTGRKAQLVSDLTGKLITLPYANPENFVSGLTSAMTGTTTTSLIGAPSAGLRNYITHIIATNSHATVGTFVIIQDGSGGTTLYEGYCASGGGGFSISFPVPLRQPTTATAVYCADVTTGANVIISASGYIGI